MDSAICDGQVRLSTGAAGAHCDCGVGPMVGMQLFARAAVEEGPAGHENSTVNKSSPLAALPDS